MKRTTQLHRSQTGSRGTARGIRGEENGLLSRVSNFRHLEPEKDLLKETEMQKKSVTRASRIIETKVEELVASLSKPA